jgi:hypothetical protein
VTDLVDVLRERLAAPAECRCDWIDVTTLGDLWQGRAVAFRGLPHPGCPVVHSDDEGPRITERRSR